MSLDTLGRYLKGAYPVGVMLAAVPLIDVTIRLYPFRFGAVDWRIAAAVYLLGNYGIMLTGLAIIGAIAAMLEHRRVMFAVTAVSGIGGILAVLVLGMWVLDAVQLRSLAVQNGTAGGAERGLYSGVATSIVGIVAFFSLSIGAWRAARMRPRQVERASRPVTVARGVA